jgi:GTP cyclohydrolase I
MTLIHWDNHYINPNKIAHITYKPGQIVIGLAGADDIVEQYATETAMQNALQELLEMVGGQ